MAITQTPTSTRHHPESLTTEVIGRLRWAFPPLGYAAGQVLAPELPLPSVFLKDDARSGRTADLVQHGKKAAARRAGTVLTAANRHALPCQASGMPL